jgi:hypothetical protein
MWIDERDAIPGTPKHRGSGRASKSAPRDDDIGLAHATPLPALSIHAPKR